EEYLSPPFAIEKFPMRITRVYSPTPLTAGQNQILDEKSSHHLLRVLRKNIGDDIQIFDGLGNEFSARITHIEKQNIIVDVTQLLSVNTESPLTIHLAQGISRGEKM